MKSNQEIINWCDIMLKRNPNIEDRNFFNSIKAKMQIVDDKTHNQYCELCGQYLGTSVELDDGYYEQFGEFELKSFVELKHTHFYYRKHLCNECQNKKTNEFIKLLSDFGFTNKDD